MKLRLALNTGAPFTIIGNDGGLLDQAYAVNEIVAAPGERFDVLLDFRAAGTGATAMMRDLDANWDILEFRVIASTSGASLPMGSLRVQLHVAYSLPPAVTIG